MTSGLEIAIVGMACRFPGASSPEAFWDNLRAGRESIRFFTDEELLAAGVSRAELDQPGYIKASSVVDGIDLFDAGFFGFSPMEAAVMDPQHRLFLECCHEALERAGHGGAEPGLVGVYGGASASSYVLNNLVGHQTLLDTLGIQVLFSNDKDYLATRVAYELDLRGPAVSVQTGCSTGLVAVHMACRALLGGECDLALAGGATVAADQERGYVYSPQGLYSRDGHCRAFDAAADGSLFGSGVGVVVLRRLADALEDGDRVLAVILGSAINNDGSAKVGYTAPSVTGQAEVIRAALQVAEVEPDSVHYIECHGSGTALGDPIEVAALGDVFAAPRVRPLLIGSVKTNVGHLDSAAGVAGLVKTVLALQHDQLPASLHFERPNPRIDFERLPIAVNAALAPWPRADRPRRAGVSSFGVGGTNAHVVVEEAPAPVERASGRRAFIWIASARTAAALDAMTEQLARAAGAGGASAADVAFTLQLGRAHHEHRRAVVCHDLADGARVLRGEAPARLLTSHVSGGRRPIAYLFPGLGDQYPDMGLGLYATEARFREEIDRCADVLRPILGADLREVIYPRGVDAAPRAAPAVDLARLLGRAPAQAAPDPAAARLDRTEWAHPALFAVEYALAQLWRSWGAEPEAMLGYSLGEYVAACLAGVFSLEDALRMVALRARVIQGLPAGAMLGVAMAEAEAVRYGESAGLALSAVNGPSLCVLAGAPAAVDRAAEELEARQVACRRVASQHAFHTAALREATRPTRELAREMRLHPPRIPFLSNVTGDWIAPDQAVDPDYWARHMMEPVQLDRCLDRLWSDASRILVEAGPGQTLSSLALMHPGSRGAADPVALPSLPSPLDPQPDQERVAGSLARLWLAGGSVDWMQLWRGEQRRRVLLPTYPFERQRHWIDASGPAAQGELPAPAVAPDQPFHLPTWRETPRPARVAARPGPWLLLAGDALGEGLARALRARGDRVLIVRPGAQLARPGADEFTLAPGDARQVAALLSQLGDGAPRRWIHAWSLSGGAERAIDLGCATVAALGRAALEAMRGPVELHILTRAAHAVVPGEPVAPLTSTVLGLARVLPQEVTTLSCRAFDVGGVDAGSWIERELVADLVDELDAEEREVAVALRGRRRYVPAHARVELPARGEAAGSLLRDRGVYLVTGGLTGIGGAIAAELAETCRARLVLVGRTALPAEPDGWLETHPPDHPVSSRLLGLRALEAAGTEVLALSADVASPEQLRSALEAARGRFGALHGVVHAAGATDPSTLRPLSQLTRDDFELHFAAKVRGTMALAAQLADQPVDFCLLVSSISSVLGGLTLGAYASANAFLDAFADQQAARSSFPWISAAIDGEGFALDRIRDAVHRVLQAPPRPRWVISPREVDHRVRQWVARGGAEAPAAPRVAGARPDLRNPFAAPVTAIEKQIAAAWEEFLGVRPVGIHDNFFELGGSSLLGLNLVARLSRELGTPLSTATLFQAPTVSTLAGLVAAAATPGLPTDDRIDEGVERGQRRRARNRRRAGAETDE